jgi:hypothetical protein
MSRMRRAAAPSRQPSSSRGGWLAHQERRLPAAQRRSETDPTDLAPVLWFSVIFRAMRCNS